eukprot:comp4778_c0_seq1/m.912 comp4778_c0_seq1/g.912  ORF comp4778_c0_seq1/g.912 comp4778_c0_seq1/m.912 type:complete len:828 (-) comp4778_c0_seq1:179-2662(-)
MSSKPKPPKDKAHPPPTKKVNKQAGTPLGNIFAGVVLLAAIAVGALYGNDLQKWIFGPRVTTWIKEPSMLDLDQFKSDAHQAKYLWGTYRPQVYFGMRAKTPTSPLVGMMYFSHHSRSLDLRHTCEHGDHMRKYGWRRHDGSTFGQQTIHDQGGFIIHTDFVKTEGDKRGGSWTARISGEWPGASEPRFASIILYTVDQTQSALSFTPTAKSGYRIEGSGDLIGKYSINFPTIRSKHKDIHHFGYHTSHVHNLTDLVRAAIYHGLQAHPQKLPVLPDQTATPDGASMNLVAVQMTLQFPFTIDMAYTPLNDDGSIQTKTIHGKEFTKTIKERAAKFDEEFERKFGISRQGLKDEIQATAVEGVNVESETDSKFEFAQYAFSNLIGGVGYFYGSSKVIGHADGPEVLEQPKAPLLTAVPSRSFFPRGFMWDEGFHQLIIQKWDPMLTKEILAHWFNLMNVDGWIAREQILGEEARSKVPAEFVIQRDKFANPPTFFLVIRQMLDSMEKETSRDHPDYLFLQRLYPRLQKWYSWYNTSQTGPVPTSYRWRGRDPDATNELNPKTLTSGLDDYPRSSHPSSDERHLDLRCWMQLGAEVMAQIAKGMGVEGGVYEKTSSTLKDNEVLNKLHWCPKAQRYYDYGNDTAKVSLQKVPVDDPPSLVLRRVTRGKPHLRYVPHFGYNSLFPLLLKLLEPSSEQLARTMEDLRNPELLWTDFGLRSLSKDSSLYMKYNTEHDAPYWRGPVWLNLNYLATRALHHYANTDGPHAKRAGEIYTELRRNLIENMFRQYKQTGYIWEQYDTAERKDGNGKGTHPFTGWSSLVILLMAESY